MNTIGKYLIPLQEQFTLDLPQYADIIRIDNVDGNVYMWAVIDTEAPIVKRHFEAFKTGGEMEEPLIPNDDGSVTVGARSYLGCAAVYIQMELMLYFFEVT